MLDSLHSETLDILKKRRIETSLRSFLRHSETAQRVSPIKDGEEYEAYSMKDFFRRQALFPLRVSALPFLAHARFWALASPTRQTARSKPEPFSVKFRYRDGSLEPSEPSPTPESKMGGVYGFLNYMTRLDKPSADGTRRRPAATGGGERGMFGQNSAVTCNVYGDDRFIRIRFCRPLVETAAYCTVKAPYRVRRIATTQSSAALADLANAGATFSPMGMLKHASDLMLSKGFRIENVFNKITEITDQVEEGYIELTLHVTELAPDPVAIDGAHPQETVMKNDASAWNGVFTDGLEEPRGAALLKWIELSESTPKPGKTGGTGAKPKLLVDRVGEAWGRQLCNRWNPGCETESMPCELRRGFAPQVR